MNLTWIEQSDERFPHLLRKRLQGTCPERLAALGNIDLLGQPLTALLCSNKCPGDLILQAYDLAKNLRDQGVTVISGFHSTVEKECLRILLRGQQPIIICPARSLENLRIPSDWKQPLENGRLLLLSALDAKYRRATADLAQRRNELVAAIADKVCFIHVSPGGELETLCDLLRQRAQSIIEL